MTLELRSRSVLRQVTSTTPTPISTTEINSEVSSPLIRVQIQKNMEARKSSVLPRKRLRKTSPDHNSSPVRSIEITKTTDFENEEMAETKTIENDDFNHNVFQKLPMELKFKIFKNLSMNDRKEARLVCKEWDTIFRKQKDFKFRPKLSDCTTKILENAEFKFKEVTITTLIDPDFPSKASNVFKYGSEIHNLILVKPDVPPQNMSALANVLPNIQSLRLELTGHNRNYRRYLNLLNHDLYSLTSVCQKLAMVEVILGNSRFRWEIKPAIFLNCPKLRRMRIRLGSNGPVHLQGQATRKMTITVGDASQLPDYKYE